MAIRKPAILAFAGSPRRHGNSEQLLDAFIEGAQAAGAIVRKVVACELSMAPCRGCNACSSTGECVQRDEFTDLYDVIESADAIVFASPVYFAGVPAVLKAVLDRMQPYWARRYVLKEEPLPSRPGAMLLVAAGSSPFGFEGAVMNVKSVFAVLSVEPVGEVLLKGVDSPSDIGRHPEALAQARELGSKVAGAASKG